MNKLYLSILFLFFWASTHAISPRFMHLTSEDGLSQSEIATFYEDSRGYMWIGTVDGLNRYDGYEITVFNIDSDNLNSLPHNTVWSLTEDKYGRLWIGTDDGLCYYDPESELIHPIKYSEKNSEANFGVKSLFCTGDYLLIGTNMGLYQLKINVNNLSQSLLSDKNKLSFKTLPNLREVKRKHSMYKILGNNDKTFWLSTHNDFYRIKIDFTKKEATIIEVPDMQNTNGFRNFTTDTNNNIWLVCTNAIVRYNATTKKTDVFEVATKFNQYKAKNLSSIAIDSENNIWVSTLSQGLFYLDNIQLQKGNIYFNNIKRNVLNKGSLTSDLIYSLYVSKNNLLWVGTMGAGVNIYNPAQNYFNHYKVVSLDQQNSNYIRSVYYDGKSNIYAGTQGNGLFVMNRNTGILNKIGAGNQHVFHIEPYENSKYFIGTSRGVFIYDSKNNKISSANITIRAVFNILKSKENIYWIATIQGLIRLESNNGKLMNAAKYYNIDIPLIDFNNEKVRLDTNINLSNNNCRVLLFDENANKLYIGTEGGGLNILTLNKEHEPVSVEIYQKNENKNSLSSKFVRSLYKTADNTLWIGTYEGLNKMITDTKTGAVSFKHYTINNGMPNNMIQFITGDKMENLWLGTNGGLVKFIPKNENILLFTVADGLQSNEFSENTVYKSPEGEIFIGGVNGINSFYPRNIKINKNATNVVISNLYLEGEKPVSVSQEIDGNILLKKSISLTDSILLLANQNNIGFDFTALQFSNPMKVKYKYILEGFEKNWHTVNATVRKAKYTNLPFGRYVFKVKASNNGDIWNNKAAEIIITILPPWWKTWWFRISATVFVIVSLISFYKWRVSQLEKQKLILKQRVAERTKELENANEEISQQNEELNQTTEAIRIQKETIEKSHHKTQIISEFGRKVTGTFNMKTINEMVYKYTVSLVDATAFGIGLYNPANNNIEYKGFIEKGEVLPSFTRSLTEKNSLSAWCFNNQKNVFINNFEKEYARYIHEKPRKLTSGQPNSIIHIPLTVDKRRIGLIGLHNEKNNAFSNNDYTNLQSLAAFISIALDNADAYQTIDNQNRSIKSSIQYAKNIQQSILPLKENMDKYFDSFVIFKPKDIVSGDFYWFTTVEGEQEKGKIGEKELASASVLPFSSSPLLPQTVFIAAVDCTGHGVPGAFMSLIGNRLLNEIVNEKKIDSPAEILSYLDKGITKALKQDQNDNTDGMDVCLVKIVKNEKRIRNNEEETVNSGVRQPIIHSSLQNCSLKVTYAGAKRTLLYYQKASRILKFYKGSIKPIGGTKLYDEYEYFDTEIDYQSGDILYLSSDGITDQRNKARKPFTKKRLNALIEANATKPLEKQKAIIENDFFRFKGDVKQNDDITLIGVKI